MEKNLHVSGKISRRDLFKATAAAAICNPHIVRSSALAGPGKVEANDQIGVGFVGIGGRAQGTLMKLVLEQPLGARVVAIADCEESRTRTAVKQFPQSKDWGIYQDYRRMFDKEKLDAVFVPTTTHARVLVCIHALQAGLDVYAEKPITLTIGEGRPLVKAVRRYKRVLQVGSQQRSMRINTYASDLVRNGAIGKVHTALCRAFLGPEHYQPKPEMPIPEGLNWDMWCNQTELRPYHTELHHEWAKWWDYDGGGQINGMTGWGTHAIDQIQCALGKDDTGPVEIWPVTPGPTGKLAMRYADGTMLKLELGLEDGPGLGGIFLGEKGKIEIDRNVFTADPPELTGKVPEPDALDTLPHIQNWLDCIRTRERPTADVEIGHRTTTICHLANICRELGRKLRWDPQKEIFPDDAEANARIHRPRRKGYELPEIL